MNKIKIEPCVCGKEETLVYEDVGVWIVECGKGMSDCWCGPERPTEEEAIIAWNAVMAGRHGDV